MGQQARRSLAAWTVIAYSAKSRRAQALRAFFEDILQNSVIQRKVGIHLLQPPVFSLGLLEST
jgi:hypothetical protein